VKSQDHCGHPRGASVKLARPCQGSFVRISTPLTLLLAIIVLLVVAYAVFGRQRHVRLQAACSDAFESTYATTAPRPAFEMAYSYGEPVFQVQFATKADMQAAADANAAFLRAIDELCQHRGRKSRPFKAERAVFFQYPSADDPPVQHCCATMRAQVGTAIAYSVDARTYGLRTSKVGTPPLAIAHCPWCGSALPPPADPQPD
jgi:hypothetical protein